MNKFFHVLNIVFFTVGITLFIFCSPVVVRASSVPVINVPAGICENSAFEMSSSDSFFYFYSSSGGSTYITCCAYAINNNPNWVCLRDGRDFSYASTSRSYTKSFDGTVYGIYYRYLTISYGLEDPFICSGTQVYNQTDLTAIINHFVFGEGSLDFDMPAQDIEDGDLDIVGLSCYIMNDQTGSIDYKESIRNSFYGFTQYIFNNLSGGIFSDSFLPPILDESPLTGSIVNYVPGIALSWLSPPLDSDITYTVWIDGKSTVNYKTSADPIVNFVSDLKPATSVSYAKLKINESPLSQSGNSFYQYNTNQGFETILNYIENNSSITPPSTPWQRYSYIGLDTKISRVYIQASKEIDGNNHIGALSYVDIIDGIPSVHEGVTSIDDITASDPDTGTGNNVGVPYTVSGDTIYTGDTINNGDTYNIYGGAGLVVGGGNPLNTVKTLFNAIIRLVEALYLTHLIKWILVGFTGNPLGDFIL